MKIGLYFGTFNPIHVGHLIIANHMAEHSDLDEIWMVVTPHNPLKKKATLLDDYQRLNLVHLATEDYLKIKPSDIEFKLSQPNYTVNTLAHLQEKYPQHTFSLIMGEDNLKSLHKWKNYDVILQNYEVYVYPRISSELENSAYKNNPKSNGSWIANMSDPWHYRVKDGIGPVSIDQGKSSSIKLRKVTHVVSERRLSVTF